MSGTGTLNPSYGENTSGQYDYNGLSQDPGDATSYYPTQQAAQAAWFAANPQYASQNTAAATGSPNSTVPGAAPPAAPATSGTTGSTTNPLQPAHIPTPPTAQATTYNPATYQNSYNPQTATNELNSAAAVQDQGQNQNLMSMLAAQGISPGSSAAQAAAQNLGASQTAALAPSLVSAQQYGAGLNEQSGLSNQSALNTAGQYGASATNTDTLQNLQNLLQQQEYNSGAF